ncbi:MAG: hypothetical protein KY455_08855 [Euryarchaeota archaeon]|nr:hypothetical protein [Euryarchaeota archaeon]
MQRAVVAVVMVALFFLSGCTEAVDDPLETQEGGGGGSGKGGGGTDLAENRDVLRLPIEAEHRVSFWANGTFAATDACNLGGCLTGSYQHEVDLGPQLPDGVPVRVEASLTVPADPVRISPLQVYLVQETPVTYWYRYTSDGAERHLDVLFLASGGASLFVENYFPRIGAAETPYTLSVDVSAPNETVMAGVPVAIDAKAGEWVRAEASEDVERVVLYGPDDALIDAFPVADGMVDVPFETSGAHVLVAAPSGMVRYTTNGTSTELRPLAIERVFSESRTPALEGPTEWDFDLAEAPLAVGLYLQTTDAHGMWFHSLDETLTLTGPEGDLIEEVFQCTICLNIVRDTRVFLVETAAGQGGVAAGTYTGHYGWNGSFGLLVGEYTVGYVR